MKTQRWWRKHPNSLLRFLALSTSLTLTSLTCFQTPLSAASRRISFYHTDHLGSTTLVTDDQGRVVSQTDYAPYGATVQQTGTPLPAHQFTGQRFDTNTGLYYYNSRYYDAKLGRFIQPDPLVQNPADPQTLNRYAYARNNPVNNVDPSGYSFWKKLFQVVAAALATFAVISTGGLVAPGLAAAAGFTEAFTSSAGSIALLSATSSVAFATAAQRMSDNSGSFSAVSGLRSQINAGLQGIGTALGNTGQTISSFRQQAFSVLGPAFPETGLFPWQLALGSAGLAAILQSRGASQLRETLVRISSSEGDSRETIAGYHTTSEGRANLALASGDLSPLRFNPKSRVGAAVYFSSTLQNSVDEAGIKEASLLVQASTRVFPLWFTPSYTWGPIIGFGARYIFGYDGLSFPSSEDPTATVYAIYNPKLVRTVGRVR